MESLLSFFVLTKQPLIQKCRPDNLRVSLSISQYTNHERNHLHYRRVRPRIASAFRSTFSKSLEVLCSRSTLFFLLFSSLPDLCELQLLMYFWQPLRKDVFYSCKALLEGFCLENLCINIASYSMVLLSKLAPSVLWLRYCS